MFRKSTFDEAGPKVGGDVLLEVVLVLLGFSGSILEISIPGLEGSYRVDDSLSGQPYQLGVHCLCALLSGHALLLVMSLWFSGFFQDISA